MRLSSYGKLAVLGMTLLASSGTAQAADNHVTVKLVSYEVSINGNKVDNRKREYPLVSYNHITYFPMTWYDSRLLGLEASWTDQEGLVISTGTVTSAYMLYLSPSPTNQASMKATIPDFQVTVNGLSIDNATEQYHVLMVNNITYFPLTWKFAHDMFNWSYEWSEAEGLKIASDNPVITTVALPPSAVQNDVAYYQHYYYYIESEGSSNHVYRSSAAAPSIKELVYSFEAVSSKDKSVTFMLKDNELWFSHHAGQLTTGQSVFIRIDEHGQGVAEHRGNLDFVKTPSGTIIVQQHVPPVGNNVVLVEQGQSVQDGKSVGSPELIYGWRILNPPGYQRSYSTYAQGDHLYTLASAYPVVADGDVNNIYRIDLTTYESTKVVNAAVRDFRIINDKLYYVKDSDNALYSSDLDGNHELQLSDRPVADWYQEMDGHVFYTVGLPSGGVQLFQANPLQEDTLVLEDVIDKVHLIQGKLVCDLAHDAAYGVKILDAKGQLQLPIANHATDVWAAGETVIITNAADGTVRIVERWGE
ncbi:DUF5050 domain-containing protein [Paenibacillus sp. YYML68]|uniref:DUF5050 domain-containing protein n=1 Tax=Paenibacillus sp. YYML68 TaxID=2909250 RepID=UPI002490B6DC|nr:DUF5050 domain-containing protein [Paenibacillus sp. YYML68]